MSECVVCVCVSEERNNFILEFEAAAVVWILHFGLFYFQGPLLQLGPIWSLQRILCQQWVH